MMPVPPVAVTGIGCVCAVGADLPSCLDALFSNRGEPAPPTRFPCRQSLTLPVFEVPEAWSAPYAEDGLTASAALLLRAADEALRRSGPQSIVGKRVGVIIGTTTGASLDFLDCYRNWRDGDEPDIAALRRYGRSNPATMLARRLGLTGPALTLTNACSSGTDAIGLGAAWIRQGLCHTVLAGGADALNEITYNGFARLMVASPEPCRPFDVERAGLNLGEGAAVLVLEAEDDVRRVQACGYIRGYGTCGDAHHLTAPHPTARGLRRALQDCLDHSGIQSADVGFVNVHGTATAHNDAVEGPLLAEMLPGVPISATKGFTGHALGAAGAVEAAFVLGCLSRGELPPSRGFRVGDPAVKAEPVRGRTRIDARNAISLSLAFGGLNAALAFGRGESPCA